jgi:hypothetical protein
MARTNRRSSLPREVEKVQRGTGFPDALVEKRIHGCRVMGVVGPQDTEEVPIRVTEMTHVTFLVEMPGGLKARVRCGHSHHELFELYGNPASLMGMWCEVRYYGTSVNDVERNGRAFIEADEMARHLDLNSDTIGYSISSIAGIFIGGHAQLLGGSESDPEAVGSSS